MLLGHDTNPYRITYQRVCYSLNAQKQQASLFGLVKHLSLSEAAQQIMPKCWYIQNLPPQILTVDTRCLGSDCPIVVQKQELTVAQMPVKTAALQLPLLYPTIMPG